MEKEWEEKLVLESRTIYSQKIVELERKIEMQERREKKNNIIIRGMKRQEGREKEEVNKFIEQEFGIKEAVEFARGFGKEKGEMI